MVDKINFTHSISLHGKYVRLVSSWNDRGIRLKINKFFLFYCPLIILVVLVIVVQYSFNSSTDIKLWQVNLKIHKNAITIIARHDSKKKKKNYGVYDNDKICYVIVNYKLLII